MIRQSVVGWESLSSGRAAVLGGLPSGLSWSLDNHAGLSGDRFPMAPSVLNQMAAFHDLAWDDYGHRRGTVARGNDVTELPGGWVDEERLSTKRNRRTGLPGEVNWQRSPSLAF